MFLTFIISLPNTSATLRSVEVENRSMAVGLQTMIARVIGGIPGPILFGHFIDDTCSLWRRETDTAGNIRHEILLRLKLVHFRRLRGGLLPGV